MEEWKEIPNTNSQYYISNLGNVKSYKKGNIRLLKTRKNKSGNTIVRLHIEDKIKDVLIDKLIKELFPINKKVSPYKPTYLLKKDINNIFTKYTKVDLIFRYGNECIVEDYITNERIDCSYFNLIKIEEGELQEYLKYDYEEILKMVGGTL